MKCKNIVDGKVCGEDIIPPSRFCGICGGKVEAEHKNLEVDHVCPKCSTKITKRQKFCTECGWRIDPNIFTTKIVCTGITDEGKTCGQELDPSIRFCPECGTDQRKSLQESVKKVRADEGPDDGQPKRPRQEDDTSESSSRSDSPDSWKPPGVIATASDDVIRGREVMEVSKPQQSPEEMEVSKPQQTPEEMEVSKPQQTPEEMEVSKPKQTPEDNNASLNDKLLADHCKVIVKENDADVNMEMADTTKTSTLPVLRQSSKEDVRHSEIRRPETEILPVLIKLVRSDTGSPFAHRSETEILPVLRQVIKIDPAINQEQVMETDTSHVIENENTNAIVTLPDNKAKEHSSQTKPLSESGNPAVLAEIETKPSDITDHSRQSGKDGQTACTELNNEQPKTSGSEEQGIPPHSMMTRHSNGKVQQLTKIFEKSVQLSVPVEDSSNHYESVSTQSNKDLKCCNFSVEENSSNYTGENETGDIDNVSSPMTQDDSSDSSSSDESHEDISKTDQSSKPKQKQKKRQKNKKKEEQKKKNRKKRKRNKEKGETDSVPAKQGKKDQKSETTQDSNTEKQDNEKMEHEPENNTNRNEKQNQSNSAPVASGEAPTDGASTSSQSYADVAASNANQCGNHRNKQFVDVYFHCIVGPPMLANIGTDKLFIAFEDTSLGGWHSRKHLMKGERTLENNNVKFFKVVAIPKAILYHKVIYYNYVIEHGVGQHVTWEYVYSGAGSSKSVNRRLNVKGTDLRKGVYHRYDGVVRDHPNKTVVQHVKGFFGYDDFKKMLYRDAEFSGKTFQPHWQITSLGADGVNGEELINQVYFVVEGLKEVYCRRASLWITSEFDKIVGSAIVKPTIQKILAVLHRKEGNSYEVRILRLVTAITMAYLIMEYDITLENWAQDVLCETLLPLPDHDRKVSCDIDGVLSFFPDTRKKVTDAVLKLSRQIACDTTNPVWMYCLPGLHFLQGKCKPFEEASAKVNHNDHKPEWWGIAEFINDIDYFTRKNDPWQRSHTDVLNTLSPYFQVDYLLPRSFMTALKPEQIPDVIASGLFPSDVIQAVIFFYIRTTQSYNRDEIKPLLIKMFRQVLVQHKAEKQRPLSLADSWRTCKISGDILKESINIRLGNDLMFFALESFLVSLDLYDKVQESVDFQSKTVKEMNISKESHLTMFDGLRYDFCKWMTNQPYYNKERAFLENWNNALKVQVPQGNIKQQYLKYVEEELKRVMESKGTDDALVNIYLLHNEEFENVVQAVLSEIALKTIHKFSNFDKVIMSEDRVVMRLGDLINSLLERSWDSNLTRDPHQILEHAVTWASFPTFIDMYYKFAKHLKVESQSLLEYSIKILMETVDSLLNGRIVVRDLQKILEKRDNFIKVVHTMKDVNVQSVTAALNLREKELQTYMNTFKTVQEFTGFTVYCQADSHEMEEKIRALKNANLFPLNDLVRTLPLEDVDDLENYQPFVTVFQLTHDQLNMLPDIVECSKGLLFTKLWEERGKELTKEKQRKLTILEVLDEVWEPTSCQWRTLCEKLKKGDLFFSEFEKYFCYTESGNLKTELLLLEKGGNSKWVEERLDQVDKYRNLRSYLFGAETILEVVKAFNLKGDFSQIFAICEYTKGVDTKMNKLDKSLLNTCSVLKDVTKERAECLKKFIKCKDLVDWLRKSMPSGLRELKVFVDLASISAGEGAMEVDKVNCLHSATTGYAPLIFNLKQDCDTKKFLEKCQEVWKELDADPQLPDKLVDTSRQLAWLQTVKKSHGSVEVSSLQQAETINTKGIYQVGNLKKSGNLRKTTLTEVLELRVAGEDGHHRNLYKYEQLNDLQSRLMLVAGKAEKGKDEVDRFMLILDAVVRLGNIYTKLVEEGCVLFSQWHVKFLCERGRRACAFINFGQGEDRHTLKGRIDEEHGDVSAVIPKIAKFLEECHEKWLTYIDEKREKYYLLNFFTIDQMVILQQELVKLGSSQEPSVLIYPLLSAVKKGCTKSDLVQAMTAAKSDVESGDLEKQREMEEDNVAEIIEMKEESDEMKTARFLEEMTKAGYPIELAKKALQHVNPDDIDGGIVWCMDNEDDFEPMEVDQPVEVTVEEVRFTGWTHSQSLASDIGNLVDQLGVGTGENEIEKLKKALEKLWDSFLTSISSSVSDYLSVEHLGMILNRLAEQETFTVNRTFLPTFNDGEPNLIICHQSEIYNTVLSVYSHEDDRPLPQSDEVLLCTPHTTLDMLEIFWRRALYAENNKIHCLVNADLLDYDVSDKGEKSLERHMKYANSKGNKYKLVVVCSSENEYKSRIVAALDKYHRPQLPPAVLNIRKYLVTKLKVDKSITAIKPASTVDFDRCSVRVVKSWRAGLGKSLYKKRMVADLDKMVHNITRSKFSNVTIPLHEKRINIDDIMDVLLQETLPPKCQEPRIFHIDISHEVQEGVDGLLFQLLILGCLGNSSGHVWRKSEQDYYIIESMPLLARNTDTQGSKLKCLHHCLDLLPQITCRSPQESLAILTGGRKPPDYTDHDRLFDSIEFKSATFQRPYQYLKRLDTNCRLDDVNPNIPDGDKKQCLNTLLRHCGIKDPSWSELHHFVSFLNKQLYDFELSDFCGQIAGKYLPGFAKFVLRFLIQMSRDFSTRSLIVSEESPIQMLQRQVVDEEGDERGDGDNLIEVYQMRRRWETSPHPYLFFNPDHHSMTFLGFNIDRTTGNLIDQQTKVVLDQGIMQQNLFDALVRNSVNLAENFDNLPRNEKIMKLCNVMGIEVPHHENDPDDSYELTTDNVKKILAIYMRFRCEIPVIIMGETGCGKTRLIKFMCSLQQPQGVTVENMILMKVHGGTKAADIVRNVRKAEQMAKTNAAQYPHMDTVLFFDEANTTEAIGVIKEIMCDKSLGGKPIKLHERLKIVAACNPYRKHSEELIKRLEQAGLGYHVDADKTADKLGHVPMRRLVYRVQPLPQSMLPLVWDFGQLNTDVEEMYIRQMVKRYVKSQQLPAIKGLKTAVSKILRVSQDFMRDQKDECSFVSLRDVERVLQVMSWFYRQSENDSLLFQMIRDDSDSSDTTSDEEEMEVELRQQEMDDVTRSLVLALGVCYHACLKKRKEYRETVAGYFTKPLLLSRGADQIEEEISRCQSIFLDNVVLDKNIAKNQALMENVFMMVVCIELRIPMFLVGKPGSSKSLAKTIVADAMQGNAAHKDLFKSYKQVQMVSFQCSPLSTPDGIVGTFRQCAAYQKDKNLDRFVSIVVLDEIGLAEDSPKMPLKALHPLLEDGCPDDEEPAKYKKVAFIGISNWALDPAKMNRGILVQREVPDITELIESAEGICSTSKEVLKLLKPMIPMMADSYLDLFCEASKEMREFFGLRDFYSLLKMLYAFVSGTKKKPTWLQLKHSILRNFGGLENITPVDIFYSKLTLLIDKDEGPKENDPDCSSAGMIKACLTGENNAKSESRYLLLLTENYGALTILQQKNMDNVVIFGSSFPSDQEYTQVCRNINRIKVCMETGRTVILLNLENLYESLYDALNQYYVYFGGERYVDLGLGTHRVKCRVHKKFRLIVVAEKQIVYNKFPIPLINRLEKHFLSLKTMLTPEQMELAQKLQEWAQHFCEVKVPAHLRQKQKKDGRKIGDAFVGFHDDTCAAIILHVCEEKKYDDRVIAEIEKEILVDGQSILLWCATPEAVLQLNNADIIHTYFHEQHHESLADYLQFMIVSLQQKNLHAQITTNSKLLSTADIDILCRFINIQRQNVILLTLQSFDTEQQFCRQIKSCMDHSTESDMLLIVQCDCGDQNADLIACARYTVQGELQQVQGERTYAIHVVFLIQLPGIAGGCFTGFQCGLWHSVHIDDIHPAPKDIPSVAEMHGKTVSALLVSEKGRDEVNMETEENTEEQEMERMEINEGDVDLMDTENQEKLTVKTQRPGGQFKIDYLIKKCIQPALGNVKDPESDPSRAIARLKIIHNCLQTELGEMTVLFGIAKHLSIILYEKEKNIGVVNKNWLSSEASKPENINRAGTFRKFAVHSLESKVIPVLAGIIAFIDTNRNLDILSRKSSQDWTVGIWIKILNSPELTQLKYSSMVSPYRQQELQEVAVKMTSKEGTAFSAAMPFSWLMFTQIEEVLRETIISKDISESHFDVVMKAAEIFQTLPMGRLLSSLEGSQFHEVLKSYIVDFVYMVHPVQSEAECNLVCESVMIGCRQLIRGEYGCLLPSMLGCHMTYNLHNVRFKNFSHLVHIWPQCSQKVLDFQQEESRFYLITDEELTLDILALHVLLEHLEPSKDALNKQETRTKWLRQVCDYRPVVERIFSHFAQDVELKENQYGEICQKGIEKARSQWTRAVVVKLFIEHVCTSGKEEIDIRRCMPFWATLRDGADMKDVQSLEKVEKFLKICNKDIASQCFGQKLQCLSCENNIEGAPVRLPCDHVICMKCLLDCKTLKEYECPNCHQEFPKDLDPTISQNNGEIKKYQDYRNRCNSFFMEVVSQLCFAEGTPPSQEVVQKLLSYIIGYVGKKKVERVVSKELTIFDDSIDPTPVVRSFLLQQLMQTSGPEIDNYLSAYFTNASKLLKSSGNTHHLVELCVLVLQCMEDSLHQHFANREDEITMATKMLRDASAIIAHEINTLEKIDHISKTRFSLTIVAKYIHKQYGGVNKAVMPDANIRRLFDAAAKLCDECGSSWPRRYFVKQLCRSYGIDSYQTVTKSEASFLRWVHLPELKNNKIKECHDRYIVTGDDYKQLRETIVTTALNENAQTLEQMLQQPENEWQTRIKLLLALHREITMNNVYGGGPQKLTDKGKAFLELFILNHRIVKNKEMTQHILSNTLWRLPGNITPGMDLVQQNIFCVLTHYLVLMTEIPGKTTLITPLRKIALEPQSMMNSFYPTMPQDEMAEIKEALLAARRHQRNENPVFYRCPNGHPYVIGNCGRAAYVGRCKTCGQEIGGVGHQLRPGNELDLGIDRTERGHVLGRATRLGPVTAPERKLNRATFAVLRLLTHLSMYVGANVNPEAVCQSIKPNIEQGEVARYLLEHIDLDLTSLQNVLGKNKDDILVLIHFLLAQIMDEHNMAVIGENNPPNICGLLDKASRSNWEEEFTRRFIQPVLQDIDTILRQCNNRILNDRRLGSDPLLQILYETDKREETQDILTLHEIPAVWRYRAIISVNHLKQMIDSTKLKLPVLRLFLDEDHHLRALRFVPSIIRLHKMLIQKYGRKLDRAEATTLTLDKVKEQMKQERRLPEFEALLDDYIEAWNCVKESLETHVCPANGSLVTVAKEYCRSDITDKTPISQLLPTHRDAGLCSYALLFFLLKKQNMFLQNYCVQTKQKEDSLPKVYVKDISSAHLISYHPDRDLLPMVLANCHYSFEVGQGTSVEYNFVNLERQLMDRFLFSKSIITSLTEIETITYRSESTNAVVFKSLCDRIKQERLNPAVQSQILGDLCRRSLTDLCESLDKLDIAISFLKSVGSDPDSSLYDFMTNTLTMDNPFPSPKAQQMGKCKHTMSLWMTLALERAKFLAKYDKKAFEGISDNFKKPLTEVQVNIISDILSKLPIEQIDTLVQLIFECIVLRIDVPQNEDDEDYVDMSKISLRDAIFGYLDASPYEEELNIDDTLMVAIGQLSADKEDPNRVLTGQSVEVWSLVNKVFTQKQKQRH